MKQDRCKHGFCWDRVTIMVGFRDGFEVGFCDEHAPDEDSASVETVERVDKSVKLDRDSKAFVAAVESIATELREQDRRDRGAFFR